MSEDIVSSALAVENVTEQKLLQMEEDYAIIVKTPITNDEQLEVAMNAKRDLRSARTTTVKICKAGREDAIRIQKIWIDKEKSIVGRIEALENPLDENMEAYKAIAIEKAKEEEAEKKLPIRADLLTNAGITADPESFKYLTDSEFLMFFTQKQQEIKEKMEAEAKAEAEAKRIQELKDKAAQDAIANAYKDIRHKTLLAMGFKYAEVSNTYIFEIINYIALKLSKASVMDVTDEVFNTLVSESQASINEAKTKYDADQETARAAKAKADAEAAVLAAQREADAKKKAQEEADARAAQAKAAQEEAARIAEVKRKALAPDKEKLTEFVNSIKPDYPIVATEQGHAVIARAKQLFTITIQDLNDRISKL